MYTGPLKDSAMRRNVNVSFKNPLHMTSKYHMGKFPDVKNSEYVWPYTVPRALDQ